MNQELFERTRDLEKKLSGKQKKVAAYFLSNFERLPFRTVAEIASNASVSEPTVIRFVRSLGYGGFPELKDEFQKIILEKFGPSERLHRFIKETDRNLNGIIDNVFEREVRNLRDTQRELALLNVKQIIKSIIRAKTKYVVGLRSTAGCAYILGRHLSYVLPGVVTILDGDIKLFEGLRGIGRSDVLISISYPRYTKNVVEAVQFAKDRKALTIAITDSGLSPIARLSDFLITAPSNSITVSNSYTACLTVINTIVSLISSINKKQTEATLKEWEKAIDLSSFFYKQ